MPDSRFEVRLPSLVHSVQMPDRLFPLVQERSRSPRATVHPLAEHGEQLDEGVLSRTPRSKSWRQAPAARMLEVY